MAVKGSGALSILNDIVAEFGGDAPHSLSEYYGGGTYVPAGANPGIATSGQINFGSHYNAVAATVLNITSNVNNYDIGAQAIAAGGDKSTPVILTINAGVTVGSTSSGTAAMYTGTGWSSGTTINITNNGSIVGSSGSNSTQTGSETGTGGNGGKGATPYGGSGANGGSGTSGSASADSTNNGGNAFEHSQTADNYLSVIFDTAGTRTGGSAGTASASGGGGGGGGGGNYWPFGGDGGGGGAGTPGGSGGATGGGSSWTTPGSPGTATSGGAGSDNPYHNGGVGGTGGNLGQSGSSGTRDLPGSGGAGGSTGQDAGSSGSALSGNTGQIS
jgi:hypothetical protein